MTRFPSSDLNSDEGLERCADILAYAVEQGYNYVDNAFTYANGHSEEICAKLLKRIPREKIYLAAKSNAQSDPTAESVLLRIEQGLKNIGTDYFDFFYMWSILDEKQYNMIMRPGGPYDGALEAKRRGWIRHILFSNHAPVETAQKIMEDGAFDGVLLSYNLLNSRTISPLLKCAEEQNMGVLVMNPLAGGIIAQNSALFSGICQPQDDSVAEAALRFLYAHPQITCVLTGISEKRDIDQGIKAIGQFSEGEQLEQRIHNTERSVGQISGLCTGCSYCVSECPNQIDIPKFMQAYNMKLFQLPTEMYRRTEPVELERISVLKKLVQEFRFFPENPQILCAQCGKCMNVCTQHLPIKDRLIEISEMLKFTNTYATAHKKRLDTLLNHKKYKKVGFWPGSSYSAAVLKEYICYFGEPKFDLVFFDNSPNIQGTLIGGRPVFGKQDIEDQKLDCILITNFRYQDEIYQSLREYQNQGIDILCLHCQNDVPWVF